MIASYPPLGTRAFDSDVTPQALYMCAQTVEDTDVADMWADFAADMVAIKNLEETPCHLTRP